MEGFLLLFLRCLIDLKHAIPLNMHIYFTRCILEGDFFRQQMFFLGMSGLLCSWMLKSPFDGVANCLEVWRAYLAFNVFVTDR